MYSYKKHLKIKLLLQESPNYILFLLLWSVCASKIYILTNLSIETNKIKYKIPQSNYLLIIQRTTEDNKQFSHNVPHQQNAPLYF